jgi:hypothetical protein
LKIKQTPIQSNPERQITGFQLEPWDTLFWGIFWEWGKKRNKVLKREEKLF